jgi:hypothetical protein
MDLKADDTEVRLSDHREEAELRRFLDAERIDEFQIALKSILVEVDGPGKESFEQEILLRAKEFDSDNLKDFVFRSMAEGVIEKHIADQIYALIEDYSVEEHW